MRVSNRLILTLFTVCCITCTGCVESQSIEQASHFEDRELDACLMILVDMSGSFHGSWDERAYEIFLDISDRYFMESMGTNTKLIIGQLSGNDQFILFEGKPMDLRKRFRGPDELNQFLEEHSDPDASRVYEATRRSLDYVSSISGITENTRVLTVILSDMQDSGFDPGAERQLQNSLRNYREQGGGLALYFVSRSETTRWHELLQQTGFQPEHYIIENDLVASPQLPRFD